MKYLLLLLFLTTQFFAQTDKTSYELDDTDIKLRAWLVNPDYGKEHRDSIQQGLFSGTVTSTNLSVTGTAVIADLEVATGDFASLKADVIQMDSAATCGVDTFATTATADTVVISGALATDLYLVTGRGGSVDQQDVLQVEAKADTLIVHRLASGASGLAYNWFRFVHE